MSDKTLGEVRVRIDFNVGGDKTVDQLKLKSAELIDLIERLKAERTNNGASVASGEFIRLCSLAQTDIEQGAMWAVKAATY